MAALATSGDIAAMLEKLASDLYIGLLWMTVFEFEFVNGAAVGVVVTVAPYGIFRGENAFANLATRFANSDNTVVG